MLKHTTVLSSHPVKILFRGKVLKNKMCINSGCVLGLLDWDIADKLIKMIEFHINAKIIE